MSYGSLEELEIPYEVKRYERDRVTMLAPESLRAVHPLGKSPVLTEGVTDGDHTVAESGAIVEYLVGRHGGGRLIPQVRGRRSGFATRTGFTMPKGR